MSQSAPSSPSSSSSSSTGIDALVAVAASTTRARVARFWHDSVRFLSVVNMKYAEGYEHLSDNALFVCKDLEKLLRDARDCETFDFQAALRSLATKDMPLLQMTLDNGLYAFQSNEPVVYLGKLPSDSQCAGMEDGEICENRTNSFFPDITSPIVLVPSGLLHTSCRQLRALIGKDRLHPDLPFYSSASKLIASFVSRTTARESWSRESTLTNGEKIWRAHYERKTSNLPRALAEDDSDEDSLQKMFFKSLVPVKAKSAVSVVAAPSTPLSRTSRTIVVKPAALSGPRVMENSFTILGSAPAPTPVRRYVAVKSSASRGPRSVPVSPVPSTASPPLPPPPVIVPSPSPSPPPQQPAESASAPVAAQAPVSSPPPVVVSSPSTPSSPQSAASVFTPMVAQAPASVSHKRAADASPEEADAALQSYIVQREHVVGNSLRSSMNAMIKLLQEQLRETAQGVKRRRGVDGDEVARLKADLQRLEADKATLQQEMKSTQENNAKTTHVMHSLQENKATLLRVVDNLQTRVSDRDKILTDKQAMIVALNESNAALKRTLDNVMSVIRGTGQ